MAKQEIVYPEIGAELKTGNEALTADDARDVLGWTSEAEAIETLGEKYAFGNEYLFRDNESNKVRLNNNLTNRPFRMTLAKRYANEILRKKWKFNGEGFIVDRHGMVQDGQHRLVGLVLAEQMRKADPAYWRTYGWNGPVKMEALIVTGISERDDVVDTIDLGQKRSLGDVLFRSQSFGDVTEKEQKRMTRVLAGAARLVWLRAGGKDVSDAPHFPHSEALDFIAAHPKLKESVEFIVTEDVEKRISSHISLGYAAALHYMTAVSATDPDEYHESGPDALNYDSEDTASDFWVKFGAGDANLNGLKLQLRKLESGTGLGRDEVVGTMIKAINRFMDDEPVASVKDCRVKRTKNADGRFVLAEHPRLGGIDAEVTIAPENEPEEPESKPAPKKKAGKKKTGKSSGGSKKKAGKKKTGKSSGGSKKKAGKKPARKRTGGKKKKPVSKPADNDTDDGDDDE